MKNKTAIIVASVSLLGLGAYFYFKRKNQQIELLENPSVIDPKKEEIFWRAYKSPKRKVTLDGSQTLEVTPKESALNSISKNGWWKEYQVWVKQKENELNSVLQKAKAKERELFAMN